MTTTTRAAADALADAIEAENADRTDDATAYYAEAADIEDRAEQLAARYDARRRQTVARLRAERHARYLERGVSGGSDDAWPPAPPRCPCGANLARPDLEAGRHAPECPASQPAAPAPERQRVAPHEDRGAWIARARTAIADADDLELAHVATPADDRRRYVTADELEPGDVIPAARPVSGADVYHLELLEVLAAPYRGRVRWTVRRTDDTEGRTRTATFDLAQRVEVLEYEAELADYYGAAHDADDLELADARAAGMVTPFAGSERTIGGSSPTSFDF